MHYVLDNCGKKYLIKDINKFFQHLIDFHTNEDLSPDNSIHEENGHYFTIL